MNGILDQAILQILCERLEALCEQQSSYDLMAAVAILEELAWTNPRLEAMRPELERILEADDRLLDGIAHSIAAPDGGKQ
ncbi:hypothetical protein [Mesorhizobium captivum]|uniref:hypothetical protein n=1 Tax=Mesorhizobium captivum TaxID=3072319 RepID=UPI002A24A209|nr:hypothetical protein [Mesorhizobium sp. VK3C]MDX8450703.1 hypothetical protein [Mesorhizobium sp. VK3C]